MSVVRKQIHVTGALGYEEGGGGDHSLSSSCGVKVRPSVEKRLKASVNVADVISREETTRFLPVDLDESGRTSDRGDGHSSDEREPKLESVLSEDVYPDEENTDDTRRDLHEDGGERVESETFGDKTSESTNTA